MDDAGVGASAGGLEAVSALLRELDALHESSLASILARQTAMRVLQATDGPLADDEALEQVTALSTARFKRWLLGDAHDIALRSLPTGSPDRTTPSP